MARPMNPDLSRPWKLNMPATLAGKVEYLLLDPIHQKPLYGARLKLVCELLEQWLARESGKPEVEWPRVSTVQELRDVEVHRAH